MWYWLFKLVLIGPVLRLIGRPRIEGLENIPTDGPAILASNHLAVVDSLYLPLMVPRRITFLAKSEYFTTPGIKGRLNKFFYSASGQVPVDRSGGQAAQAALRTAARVLEEGRLLGLYPEGTRSPDGRLYKGKTGIARMALEIGVPIIPVAMVGTGAMNPIGSKGLHPTKITLRVGEPLDFSRYEGLGGSRFIERAVTDEVMYALMNLGGQEYVDMYAAGIKDAGMGAQSAWPRTGDGAEPSRIPDTEAS